MVHRCSMEEVIGAKLLSPHPGRWTCCSMQACTLHSMPGHQMITRSLTPAPGVQVNYVTSFNSTAFPDSLVIAKEDLLMIGALDSIQKLQIRTVPLGEQPRRICHQEASRTFAVLCQAASVAIGAPKSAVLCMHCPPKPPFGMESCCTAAQQQDLPPAGLLHLHRAVPGRLCGVHPLALLTSRG